MKRFLICASIVLVSGTLGAQTPAPAPAPPGTQNVEVDPIRCWWKTSAGSVRIGEQFDLSMTCAVLENEGVQVVPDESRLGPAVAQMPPYEVVSGSHPADLHSGARRFFQYQYRLRLIAQDAIGKDVPIPAMVLHYRINSRVAANASVQGRDLTYVLNGIPVRIDSLVPTDATDIRDAAGENFANVENLNFRASALEIVSISAMALAALMIVIVLVGVARRARKRTPADARLLSTGRIAAAASQELKAVENERGQSGWNEALVSRAVAAIRVLGGCALGRGASQRIAETNATAGEGRLLVAGPFRGKRRVLSSSTTAGDLARAAALTDVPPARQQAIESLHEALQTFSRHQFSRDAAVDQTSFDAALSSAQSAAATIRAEHTWLKTFLRGFRAPGTPAESRA